MADEYNTYDDPKIPLLKLIEAPNITELLTEDQLERLGNEVRSGYQEDLDSRKDWEERTATANKLALQVKEPKTSPWINCANVKFPLVTVGALQYHARAYPNIISGTDVAECRVIGEDKTGEKEARAERIKTHMSWQCLEQDTSWEEEHDKLLLVQPIVGCAFVKTIFDQARGHLSGRMVLPMNFVINYWSKDIPSSQRYTHTFPLTSNIIKQRQLENRYRVYDTDEAPPTPTTTGADNAIQTAQDRRQGVTKPSDSSEVTPYFTGEQYCWYDFDGDGYKEPYIITFDINSGKIWRIVARYSPAGVKFLGGSKLTAYWDESKKEFVGLEGATVYDIKPINVFTKYPFIPSPDGGFYDLGLGALAGPVNESVNTAINQIFDAGTMATLGGGFVGRGFKSKGGPFTFRPNEWHPTDAPGDDLRKNVLPLPIREPSNVLFQLLGFLVQYGERIVSTTEIQVGESQGQNQKAETTRILDANGARVYTAIWKRVWRAMREELRIRYDLNATFLEADDEYTNLTTGKGAMIMAADYRGSSIDVVPSADPHVISEQAREKLADQIVANAFALPGHNKYKALVRAYKIKKVPNIDEIMPPPMGPDPQDPKKRVQLPDFPPQPNVKMEELKLKQAEFQLEQKKFEADQQEAKMKIQGEINLNQAAIIEKYAKAENYLAQAKGVESGHMLALIDAEIALLRAKNEGLKHGLDMMMSMSKGQSNGAANGTGTPQLPNVAGMAGMEAQPPNTTVPGPTSSLN